VIDDEDMEFIELLNTGSQTVSLEGISISEFASEPYTFGSGVSLAAGERIIVARSPAVFQSVYGAGIRVAPVGYGNANLSNGGERIALLGPLGETLQDFVFNNSAPWPAAADGDGPSLEIIDPLGDPSNPSNWRASATIGGSPGTSGAQLKGDYDGNSIVDEDDRNAWRANFGSMVTPGSGADGNGDGVIDTADYIVWREAFGNGSAAANGAAAFVVPTHSDSIIQPAALFVASFSSPIVAPQRSRPPARMALSSSASSELEPFDKLLLTELNDAAIDSLFSSRGDQRYLLSSDRLGGIDASETPVADTLYDVPNLWVHEAWLSELAALVT
jgi:hypothetical protein